MNYWKLVVIIAVAAWSFKQGTQHYERVGALREQARQQQVTGSRRYLRPTAEGVGLITDSAWGATKTIVGGTVKLIGKAAREVN